MPDARIPLFVRLPRAQAAALDRLADATGRHKQHLVSELLADRLTPGAGPISVGRVEVANTQDKARWPELAGVHTDEVLTLEEAAALLKLSADAVRARAEDGELPGRRFGKEWRFARMAILAWLADGETRKGRRTGSERT
jgi:excisionase family DNA binding protein